MEKDYRQEIFNIFGTDDIEELKEIAKSMDIWQNNKIYNNFQKKH